MVNVGDRVFFESDQTDLSPQATATLDKQAQWLMTYRQYSFTIEGTRTSAVLANTTSRSRAACPVGPHLSGLARHRPEPDAHDLLRQGTPGRGLQRHLLLVAEPPRRHGPERQLLSVRLISILKPAPSGAGFVLDAYSAVVSVTILAYSLPQWSWLFNGLGFLSHADFVAKATKSKCHPDFSIRPHCGHCRDAGLVFAGPFIAAFVTQAWAQSDDADPEMRIQQLENQLRQLTGQNEELQHQNQLLQDQLRALQGGGAQAAPGGPPPVGQPNVATLPPAQPNQGYQPNPGYRQPPPQPGYSQPQIAAPAPIYQDEASPQAPVQAPIPGRRRGDAFDPNQNPNAPGAPRALGGGQMPVANDAPVSAPGGRAPGEPLNLGYPGQNAPGGAPASGLATLPPSATPRDEFDLGIGYMERKDYALAEQTMRNFAQKYPGDPLLADSQYWLGESLFQRQQYRDAAEAFLAVTTKYDKYGQGARCAAAARTVAGGPEGEGGRLCRLRRSDAQIFARLQRRQGGGGPRAKTDQVLTHIKCKACRPASAIASQAFGAKFLTLALA